MRLEEFLELIGTEEIISIYDPVQNLYLQFEKHKENIKEEYLNYKVIGINTDYDDCYNAVLEIDISII